MFFFSLLQIKIRKVFKKFCFLAKHPVTTNRRGAAKTATPRFALKAQFLLNVVITVIVMTVIKDFGLGFHAI